jgi:hypothetical protein
MPNNTSEPDDAPGWDAIDAALLPLYGDREPYHVGTVVPYAAGGPDPIHGISAYHNAEPGPHWHFVTYGFSELWAKELTDSAVRCRVRPVIAGVSREQRKPDASAMTGRTLRG